MNHKKKISVLVGVVISMMLVVSVPTAKAQFVIAEWDFPDEYGQGISKMHFYENSTGSWVEIYGPTPHYPYNDTLLDWAIGVGIKIRCSVSLNSTLHGLTDDNQGMDLIRHSITVTSLAETVFSQQNFTYFGRGHVGAMYYYHYDVVLNFLPQGGQFYTAIIIYEVWW